MPKRDWAVRTVHFDGIASVLPLAKDGAQVSAHRGNDDVVVHARGATSTVIQTDNLLTGRAPIQCGRHRRFIARVRIGRTPSIQSR